MHAPAERTCLPSPPTFSSACASAQPRVHCITNAVAQNFTANVLLAAGAMPSMTIAPKEVGAFAARADALLVNLGTFDRGARRRRPRPRSRVANQDGAALGARSGADRPLAAARGFARDARRRRRRAAIRLNARRIRARCGGNADDAALTRFARGTHAWSA